MVSRVPNGVLAALTAILLALGGEWWLAHAPVVAPADPGAHPGNRLVQSIGGGLTVERRFEGRPLIWSCVAGPGLRNIGQDTNRVRC
jgi:hypothetical protein